MSDPSNQSKHVIIPIESLKPEILSAIIEEFILREGTEYGEKSYTLEEKVSQIKEQIITGKVEIIYDLIEDSCTLRIK